jgi:hypothetical protein
MVGALQRYLSNRRHNEPRSAETPPRAVIFGICAAFDPAWQKLRWNLELHPARLIVRASISERVNQPRKVKNSA